MYAPRTHLFQDNGRAYKIVSDARDALQLCRYACFILLD